MDGTFVAEKSRHEKPRLFFDVSGLLQWFAYKSEPSGIQRVSTQIIREAMWSDKDVELIARCPGSNDFFSLSSRLVSDLVGETRQQAIRDLRLLFSAQMRSVHPLLFLKQARIGHVPYVLHGLTLAQFAAGVSKARLEPQGRPVPTEKDVIVGLGDFWCHPGHANSLVNLKMKTGATLVHMIHDLYALNHPEWTHPYYGPQFTRQFAFLAPHVDRWLANSNFVESQINSCIDGYGIEKRHVEVVPMGWDSFPDKPNEGHDRSVLDKFGLSPSNYILHVGTIEPRKNLLSLIDAMCRLQKELGDKTPTCILVGRAGWRSSDVQRHLDRTFFAGGKIRWLAEVGDSDLPSIYRGARFTVMPSLAEGWGLPVQESLAHGVPCIASNVGGLPEAGLDLARYIDPVAGDELFSAIKHWVVDDHVVGQMRTKIRARLFSRSFSPTWREAAQTVLRASEAATRHRHEATCPALSRGLVTSGT